MKFETVLSSIGDFGKYQKILYSSLVLPQFLTAIYTLATVFTLQDSQFSCKLPQASNGTDVFYLPDNKSHCSVYVSRPNENLSTQLCTSWDFALAPGELTVIKDFSLVCDQSSMITLAGMAFFLGTFIGVLLNGIIGDTFGRRTTIFFGTALMIPSAVICTFSTNIAMFIVLRFFIGMSIFFYFDGALILSIELVGVKQRVLIGIIIEVMWCVGMLMLCLLAYFIRDWRTLQLVVSLPSVALVVYFCVLPESPRWLLANGRTEEALSILKKVARFNGKSLPEGAENIEKEKHTLSDIWPIIKSPRLFLRWLMIIFTWFTVSLSYYGLTFNVGQIGGDIYVNFLISAIVEALGYLQCIYTMKKFGRKLVNCASFSLAAVSLLCTIFVKMYAGEAEGPIMITFSMIGKFAISSAFGNIYVFTVELFPTTTRSFVLATSSAGGRIGFTISPYIARLGILVPSAFGKALPSVVFGVLAVVAAILSLLLPETKNKELPQSTIDLKGGKTISVEKNETVVPLTSC